MKNELVKKYTTKHRKFKTAPDNRYLKVYIDGRLNGFIFNNNKKIFVNGEEVTAADFFR